MEHYRITCGSSGYSYAIISDDGAVLDQSEAWFTSSRAAESAASFVLRARLWSEANPDRQPPIGDSDIRGGVPVLQEKARHRAWLGHREAADA